MPVYAYTARLRSGEKVEDSVEAASRRAAMEAIERLGRIPVSVRERGELQRERAKAAPRRFTLTRTERMRTRDVLVFTTELSDLLASGMKLGNALNCLANRRTGQAGDRIIAALRDEIIRGASLSEALALQPASFSRLYVSMIRAGETSGALADVLARLVTHYERIQEVKEKVGMALVYPMIVLTLGVATLIFSMVYVVPKFETVFRQLGETLPLPTRMLIASSRWLAQYGWMALIAIVIALALGNRAVKTKQGQLWWHGLQLRMPLIKGIVFSSILANLARTLGTLLANGVPVLQALGIVEQTAGNAVIARELRRARDRVTDGTTISGPLAKSKVFPSMMTDMLSVGEQTGDMSGALSHIARRYESELDRNVKIFTTALEPLLIVLVALMVGFVAVSILMAVFNLTNGLNA